MSAKKKARAASPIKKDGIRLFFLLLPFIVGTFIFAYLPLFGWTYAFVNYKPGRVLAEMEYVGLKWFSIPFSNPVFRMQIVRVLKNTIGINMIYMAAMVLPMFFAMFLTEIPSARYKKVVQTLTTIPHFISWVLVYAAFFALLSSDGLINNVAIRLGLRENAINYLTDAKHPWLKMLLYHEWKSLGWSAIMYISAITSIDQEIYEAADIDGAGRFSKMFYVTLPHLLPTFFVLLVMQIGNMLNSGMDQYMMFSNPLTKDGIEVLDLYLYNNGLKNGQISYSTAIGMLKTIIGIILLTTGNMLSKLLRGESIF